MILKVFSLYDTKTGIYGTPFYMIHAGQAVRACQDLAEDMNTTIGRHPADYTLCELGHFDDQTGVTVTSIVPIGAVINLLEVRQQPPLFEVAQSSKPEAA